MAKEFFELKTTISYPFFIMFLLWEEKDCLGQSGSLSAEKKLGFAGRFWI